MIPFYMAKVFSVLQSAKTIASKNFFQTGDPKVF